MDVKKCNTAFSSILLRDDFDAGPISINLIEENLYLGNLSAACDALLLIKLNIKSILTIDSVPLPQTVTSNHNFNSKYIQVADVAKEDLISHFDQTFEFIDEGMKKGGVLVHCYFGMSRSAAVVIAFMMAKYKLSYEEAFYITKAKRSIVCPNEGFVAQLKLYRHMECKLDKGHPKYRQFRLKMAAENVRKVKILPQTLSDLIKPDPGLTRERPDPLVYRCKKCRRIIALQNNIIPHIPHDVKQRLKQKSIKKREIKANTQSANSLLENTDELIEKLQKLLPKDDPLNENTTDAVDTIDDPNAEINKSYDALDLNTIADNDSISDVCTQTYFIEPLAWMQNVNKNMQGKLHCPKCSNKLGSYSWTMGCQCPCGTKVAPAFYLVPSKVEKSNVVQNIQVTV